MWPPPTWPTSIFIMVITSPNWKINEEWFCGQTYTYRTHPRCSTICTVLFLREHAFSQYMQMTLFIYSNTLESLSVNISWNVTTQKTLHPYSGSHDIASNYSTMENAMRIIQLDELKILKLFTYETRTCYYVYINLCGNVYAKVACFDNMCTCLSLKHIYKTL